MNDYEVRRLAKIKHNQELLAELDIKPIVPPRPSHRSTKPPPSKKRKLVEETAPSRTSARLAASTTKPNYNDDAKLNSGAQPTKTAKPARSTRKNSPTEEASPQPTQDISALREAWTAWTPAAPEPTRDDASKQFRFASHPAFTPNKSPEEMLREGVFGGAYFRPLRSRKLGGAPVADDWQELPAAWLSGLDPSTQLARAEYAPEVNKFGVACGQSIEEWEANGWIRHEFDVRGWFQWYARFFRGRRCADDDRQVGRWERCVGPRGRWRRMLLKAYLKAGVRTVWDDGEDEDAPEVSPVMHQTCLHWAWEVRQDELDEVWERGGL